MISSCAIVKKIAHFKEYGCDDNGAYKQFRVNINEFNNNITITANNLHILFICIYLAMADMTWIKIVVLAPSLRNHIEKDRSHSANERALLPLSYAIS